MLKPTEFYLRECYKIAANSGDLSTRNGAVLVDPASGEIAAYGFNDLPRGVKDLPARRQHPDKLKWVIHAEHAAVLHAAQIGQMTFGLVMYCAWAACHECSKAIAQAHLSKLVRHVRPEHATRPEWAESCALGDLLLAEAGVEVEDYTAAVGSEMLFGGRTIAV